jgi:outer membrane immunogenic protein
MKTSLLLAAAGMLGLAALPTANAADLGMPTKAPPAPMPVPVYSWTGFYVGANFGGGWAHTDFTDSTIRTFDGFAEPSSFSTGSRSDSGIAGGGQIGFNYQFMPQWVVGLEADIDGSHITGHSFGCAATAAGVVTSCATGAADIQDFGTVRGRVGYAFNNLLLYGTGGWAWVDDKVTSTVSCVGAGCPGSSIAFTINSPSASTTPSGWAAGAGVEWGFLPNWTVRIEYLHLQFNGVGSIFNYTGTAAGGTFADTSHASANSGLDVVRVGLNYLFNFAPAPVVTRY